MYLSSVCKSIDKLLIGRVGTMKRKIRLVVLALMASFLSLVLAFIIIPFFQLEETVEDDAQIVSACLDMIAEGLPPISNVKNERFTGKVSNAKLLCNGGSNALASSKTPWVDWANYWGVGDSSSKSNRYDKNSRLFNRAKRGVDGALIDLEYQRMELIKFNLYDTSTSRSNTPEVNNYGEPVWSELQLQPESSNAILTQQTEYASEGCSGDLIRFRTLTGICNDIFNPMMGSSGMPFARNVEFSQTFPLSTNDQIVRNRHRDRISFHNPDPFEISRELLWRDVSKLADCEQITSAKTKNLSNCEYKPASTMNVLAAFWIQFMTHDWFSHLDNARNSHSEHEFTSGCFEEKSGHNECVDEKKVDKAIFFNDAGWPSNSPSTSNASSMPQRVSPNFVTAWWDASQIYGWDKISKSRVIKDPNDPAKLYMISTDNGPMLPRLKKSCDNTASSQGACQHYKEEWAGQEAVAFPDNWTAGTSFFHNIFAREHNIIVDEFRKLAKQTPDADSGLRDPENPNRIITYSKITDAELFEITRLIVAAEIAKIHTIEWTTQLLYNEPLFEAMQSNWSGLFDRDSFLGEASERLTSHMKNAESSVLSNQLYSAFAAGGGIIGRGSELRFPPYLPDWASWDRWDLNNPKHLQGGVNHFGSPFNFPEAFPSVYRLHALVPESIEYREMSGDPNEILEKVPLISTFRGGATDTIRDRGLSNIGLSMGRQRLGALTLNNHPRFLTHLDLTPRLENKVDVMALDIIRDRERGLTRYNEFRRQIGLRSLTSFDDFIDQRLPIGSANRNHQEKIVKKIRHIYGQHVCDNSLIISTAGQLAEGKPVTDCLGHADGALVDNIEDVDLLIGWHAEFTRPHGFAISETQFQIFILNASRRLFSDRFFTSSYRPEFYTKLGIKWINENGPNGLIWEDSRHNGHKVLVSPLKRVLLRTVPSLSDELSHVKNVFDPWARDRGEYYSLKWRPRKGAVSDPAFGTAID
jgi:hypothetical protein